MSRKPKFETKLSFDSAMLQSAMMHFFDTYKTQLPPFLKDTLQKGGVMSDPAIIIGEKEIKFQTKNTNKGAVIVYLDDKQKDFKTIDYKLVPNDSSYLQVEQGQFVIYFKRSVAPDDTIGMIPTLEDAIRALKTIEDPILIQKRIDEIDDRDKDRVGEVLEDVAVLQGEKAVEAAKEAAVVAKTGTKVKGELTDKPKKAKTAKMKVVK